MILAGLTPSYPGHNCPGLIEASNVVGRIINLTHVIRGITAPASLKPGLFGDYPRRFSLLSGA
ncbi:protein of unknown function [Candidatus Methylocalor cossyra]|uniref:Uncharacterized protein n=1 Tax=Candidatus Methylocalor cossyra TaxID=3108543 RepID=A0ABM9NK93_9GAMM